IPDVARTVRRVGITEVLARESRPEPEADGHRVRRHLLSSSARSRYAPRRDDGRTGAGGAEWEGPLRRDLVVHARANPASRGLAQRPWRPVPDSPAEVQHAGPRSGERTLSGPQGGGNRVHSVLPVGAGTAHGPLSQGDSRGLPGGQDDRIPPA